jgi:hypothetical protein
LFCSARLSARTASGDSGTAKCRGFSDLVLLTRKPALVCSNDFETLNSPVVKFRCGHCNVSNSPRRHPVADARTMNGYSRVVRARSTLQLYLE